MVEGSIPNEKIKKEGYWAALGTDPDTGQPITTSEWIDRLAPKALAVVGAGTCATYGGIHAMEGNPTGCMGLADYLGWDWKSKAGLPIVNVPGCPVQPDNFMETLLYLLYQVAGLAPMIPLDDQLRPTWLFGKTVHEGCDRAGYYEQGDFADEYGSPKCLVKLGCWGPVVNCNVPKRGWMAGIGGCPNVGGICIGCTMPGFPDKFMPFMDEPPGARASRPRLIGVYGRADPRAALVHQRHGEQRTEVAASARRADHRLSPQNLLIGTKGGFTMSTITAPQQPKPPANHGKLVEMNWDPITRIVGSLGIYTKIDFDNREVAECHSTSSIFRGYSIFMKGKDPRDAHFITSRICGICGDNHATCAAYAQNMAFGIKPPPHGRVDRQPRRSRRVHVRPQHLPGQPGRRRFLRADGQGDQSRVSGPRPRRPTSPHAEPARLPHHRRHHAALNPFTGEFYREALQMSRYDARDVLPDGRPARPSLDALSRRRRHGAHGAALHRLPRPADEVRRVHEEGRAAARRPVRLLLRGAARLRRGRPAPHPARLLGLVQRSRRLRLHATRT